MQTYFERVNKRDPNYRDLKANPLTQEELDKFQLKEDIVNRTKDMKKIQVEDLKSQLELQLSRIQAQLDVVVEVLNTYS